MKNAILLHGKLDKDEYYSDKYPSASNSHWFPWLQKQLLMRDIAANTPEVANSYIPDYATWCKEFERFDITPDTILVGHSCGGGFIVRWLSEHPDVRVGKVVLVAPWIDPSRDDTTDFFEFTIDPNLASRTQGLIIFSSDNDYASVQESVRILREAIKDVRYREFHEYGHFCLSDLKTEAFPELLEEILR
jgi:predicted alpha/beta hydrolase family esterase